jgi:hypothetical protein
MFITHITKIVTLWSIILISCNASAGTMEANLAPNADAIYETEALNPYKARKVLPYRSVQTHKCLVNDANNKTESSCGQGLCEVEQAGEEYGICNCLEPYKHVQYPDFANISKFGEKFLPVKACAYKAKLKKEAFFYSLFLGIFGADWFYLAAGNRGFICIGFFKMFTFGGLLFWWILDLILLLTDQRLDGMGMPLFDDLAPAGA